MNIVFFGDDRYSSIVLQYLISYCQQSTIHDLAAIITTQPKPKGRNKIIEPNPVEKLARRQKIKVLYYSAKEPELNTLIQYIKDKNIELGVLTSFGHILSEKFLNTLSNGIINIHPSLLPQYRGSTPIQHALAMGDQVSGITLFTLTEQIDNGKILAQNQHPIEPSDNTLSLSTKLFEKGTELLIQILDSNLQPLTFPKLIQPKNPIYTRIFSRQNGFIEWGNFKLMIENKSIKTTKNNLINLRLKHNPSDSQNILYDLHRALHPWPGIWTETKTKKGKKRLKITQVKPNLLVQLEGKPNPVSWQEFKKYYL